MVDQPLPGDFQAVLQRTALQKHLLEAEVMISLRDLVVSCLGPRVFFAGKQGGSQKWQLVESTYYTEFMIMALTLLKLYTHFLVVWKTVETRHYRRNIYSRWTLEQLNCPVEIFEAPGPWSFLVVGCHNALCPGLAAAVQNLASGYWLHIKITGDKWCLLFMVIPIKI